MSLRRSLVLTFLLIPGFVLAQDVPEQLLSAKTQLYLRWDGNKAHRAAYLKTALGKMLQGDTGKLIDNLFGLLKDNLAANLTVSGLLEGAPPAKVEKFQAEVAQASKVLDLLSDHGLIVAAEVQGLLPPKGQITLIVPNAGKAESLFAALRLLNLLEKEEVKELKVADRTVSYVSPEGVSLCWWTEGKHAVVVLGTGEVQDIVKGMAVGDHARLPSVALYKKVTTFKEFETSARAFLDTEALVKMGAGFGKEVTQAIDVLGLNALKAVTFQSGYDGDAERGLTEIHYSGERKGLLGLMTGKPFKLSDVPPLPNDVISWSMTTFDAAATYDAALKGIETIAGLVDPQLAGQIKDYVKQVDQVLGIDLRKDLFGAMGDRMLSYSSPGEGVFSLSQTMAFKVKSPDKLLDTLDQALKGVGGFTNAKMSIKKRKYRDVDTREIRVNEQGFFFLPTYAVVGDWLVVSFYPQPVHGFILRSKGELPTWKPEESVEGSLAKMPKEMLSISVSDPRPSVKQVFALAPIIGSAFRSFMPDSKFDPGLIPNSHEACKHLFPNVSVASDDGKTTRLHTRASLSLPFDVAGIDTYILAFAGIGFFSAFADK